MRCSHLNTGRHTRNCFEADSEIWRWVFGGNSEKLGTLGAMRGVDSSEPRQIDLMRTIMSKGCIWATMMAMMNCLLFVKSMGLKSFVFFYVRLQQSLSN